MFSLMSVFISKKKVQICNQLLVYYYLTNFVSKQQVFKFSLFTESTIKYNSIYISITWNLCPESNRYLYFVQSTMISNLYIVVQPIYKVWMIFITYIDISFCFVSFLQNRKSMNLLQIERGLIIYLFLQLRCFFRNPIFAISPIQF